MTSLFAELKRRNVFRVAIFYIVSAWLLLQIVDLIFEVLLVPDWTLRFIFGLVVAAFPFVLFFAWAYEVTPEGIKKESEIDRDDSITHQTGRKLDRLIIGLLAILIAVVAFDRFWSPELAANESDSVADQRQVMEPDPRSQGDGGTSDVSIAVLPFRDMSAAGDQDYFGEGIAEELLNALVDIKGLRVASRTSSFSFKDQNVDLRTISDRLDVSHILEGSVRTAGNRVRITAQLIDVESDAHLWSETFDRTLDDIFAIQDEITAQVVDELRGQLLGDRAGAVSGTPASAAITESPEAYRLYLRGRHEWRQRSADSLNRAVDLFREALALDPEFARAWSNLSVALLNVAEYDPGTERDDIIDEATEAADRALALEPALGEALAVKANLLRNECGYGEAEPLYEAARAADPTDPTVFHWSAVHMAAVGHSRRALETIRRAYALDPLNAAIVLNVGMMGQRAGEGEGSLEMLKESRRLGMLGGDSIMVGYGLVGLGRFEEAAQVLRESRMVEDPGWVDAFLQAVREPGPQPALEQRVFDVLQDAGGNEFILARALIFMNSDLLFKLSGGDVGCRANLSHDIWHPLAEPLRRRPETFEWLRAHGLGEYWESYGWPDLCDDLNEGRLECRE